MPSATSGATSGVAPLEQEAFHNTLRSSARGKDGSVHVKFALLSVLALVALSFAPHEAAAQTSDEPTSEVTFYGHVFGIGRSAPMPMNTQFPRGESDLSQGSLAQTCGVAPPPGGTSCEDDLLNEEWLYTTAGFVQIKNQAAFDYKKLHNERGLTKDTFLDKAKDITATFYMSADEHGWPLLACAPGVPYDVPWPVPCWNWDPGVLTQWQVQATIYTGVLGAYGGAADTQPDLVGAVASNKLVKLAEGVSAIQDVKSLEPLGNPTVWKFDINLGKPLREKITKEESYVVRFKWWSVKADGTHKVVPEADQWNVDSGEYYPPVVRLPVKGAFTVEYTIPQFVYEKLVVLGIMSAPWGSYDVDQDSIKITIVDAKGASVTPQHINRLSDFSVAHGAHYKPVNVTYVWDFRADKLPPGEYAITVAATNYQGSAASECTGKFIITPSGQGGDITVGQCGVRTISDKQLDTLKQGSAGDAQKAPGPSPGLAPLHVVGVALVVLARRWRK